MNNTINYSRTIQEPPAGDPVADRLRESLMSDNGYDNIFIGHYILDRVNNSVLGKTLKKGEHWVVYYVFFSMLIFCIKCLYVRWKNDNERERRAAERAAREARRN